MLILIHAGGLCWRSKPALRESSQRASTQSAWDAVPGRGRPSRARLYLTLDGPFAYGLSLRGGSHCSRASLQCCQMSPCRLQSLCVSHTVLKSEELLKVTVHQRHQRATLTRCSNYTPHLHAHAHVHVLYVYGHDIYMHVHMQMYMHMHM